MITSIILLNDVYWTGMKQEDNTSLNGYKISTIVLFLSVFSPFWIAYSALLKIALMQDRYEPNQVRGKSCCRKFLLLMFLTFFGTFLLLVSKLIMAVGEVVALLTMLTF